MNIYFVPAAYWKKEKDQCRLQKCMTVMRLLKALNQDRSDIYAGRNNIQDSSDNCRSVIADIIFFVSREKENDRGDCIRLGCWSSASCCNRYSAMLK